MITSSSSEKRESGSSSPSKEKDIQLHVEEIKKRFANALEKDYSIIANPELSRPFSSMDDTITRLLPYHVYQAQESESNPFNPDSNIQ
ncbi:hypothetical protein HMI54_012518, partial [Coelomomyces lativittatus]